MLENASNEKQWQFELGTVAELNKSGFKKYLRSKIGRIL